jgi:multidrug efflux system outer membrane protein
VINRVSMVQNYTKSIEFRKQQLQSLEASVDAATKLFQAARAEYIEVLFAQRDLLEARMTLIETKWQQLSAVVNSYQALGGGGRLLENFNNACPAPGPNATPLPQPAPNAAPPPKPAPGSLPPPQTDFATPLAAPAPRTGVEVLPVTRVGPVAGKPSYPIRTPPSGRASR